MEGVPAQAASTAATTAAHPRQTSGRGAVGGGRDSGQRRRRRERNRSGQAADSATTAGLQADRHLCPLDDQFFPDNNGDGDGAAPENSTNVADSFSNHPGILLINIILF